MANYPAWECDLLKALGAPCSANNLLALNLWAQSEGSVTNNALATSGQGAGATKCVAQCGSTSPIYEYATEADGVAQMAQFLKGGYYTAIVRAFQQDAGLAAIYQAINSSPWCKGCQNGQYPVVLAKQVGGAAQQVNPNTGAGSGGGSAGGTSSSTGSGSGLSTCVISFPGFLFFSGPCLLTKGGVKWLSGVAALLAGAAIGTFGVVLIAASVGKSTGATAAVKRATRTIGIPASLAAGQPEVAAGIKATTRPPATPRPRARTEPVNVGRLQSRRIEQRFRSAERDQGPIGPRGANRTSTRVAREGRRGTSYPGPRRRREPPNVPGGDPF